MFWYKHYIGDYAKDTAHLTPLQHGVYRLLIDHYYATEKPLPGKHDDLYRIVRAFSEEERNAVDFIVKDHFKLDKGCYLNDRIDKEIKCYFDRSAINKQNAKKTTKQTTKQTTNKQPRTAINHTEKEITEKEVIAYFVNNGFPEALGKKAFDFYNKLDWHDSNGKKVKGWKQKMRSIWFTEENKANPKKKSKALSFWKTLEKSAH